MPRAEDPKAESLHDLRRRESLKTFDCFVKGIRNKTKRTKKIKIKRNKIKRI